MRELEPHWLERFKKGDPEAFEVLYRAYGDCVYRVCHRMSGCAAEAEDLVQETFIAAFKSCGRFEGRASLGTWLYRLALDCCRSMKRRTGKRSLSLLSDPQTAGPASEPAIAIVIGDALMKLPERHRESILLVKIEGLKYREAAEILGVPMGTVQSWVHEGLTHLRMILPGFEAGGVR